MNEQQLKVMTEEIRLIYYNNYLFQNGIISKREHEMMNLAIIEKCGKKRKNLNSVQ